MGRTSTEQKTCPWLKLMLARLSARGAARPTDLVKHAPLSPHTSSRPAIIFILNRAMITSRHICRLEKFSSIMVIYASEVDIAIRDLDQVLRRCESTVQHQAKRAPKSSKVGRQQVGSRTPSRMFLTIFRAFPSPTQTQRANPGRSTPKSPKMSTATSEVC